MARGIFSLIQNGNVQDLEALLAENPAVANQQNEQGVSALLFALYHRQSTIAERILAHLPKLNVHEAAALGKRDILSKLVKADPELIRTYSGDGFSPLHLACFFGKIETADLLLDLGADVTSVARNPSEVTPLHSAAASRSSEMVSLLLRCGASVNARQHGGWTALHAAALHKDARMARVLLEHGADPRQRADDGRTAVDLAREKQASDVLSLLDPD
jgi:ankyrin repeat protein